MSADQWEKAIANLAEELGKMCAASQERACAAVEGGRQEERALARGAEMAYAFVRLQLSLLLNLRRETPP